MRDGILAGGWAGVGAFLMYLYLTALQRHKETQERRAKCPHRNTRTVKFMDHETLICDDCGWQEPIKRNGRTKDDL